MEKEPKVIEGVIKYKMTIDESGEWKVEYEQNLENDIAVVSIAGYVSGQIINSLRKEKSKKNGNKKQVSEILRKAIDAQFGLKLMTSYFRFNYLAYRNMMETQAEVDKIMADNEMES